VIRDGRPCLLIDLARSAQVTPAHVGAAGIKHLTHLVKPLARHDPSEYIIVEHGKLQT
jgi:hypothetical protein